MRERVRERRRSPRATLHTMLGYARRLDHGCFAVLGIGSALDVSRSGVRFVAYEAILEDSQLELQLSLDGRPARVAVGRVVRVESRGNGSFEVAVEFVELDPLARATLDRFVTAHTRDSERRAS